MLQSFLSMHTLMKCSGGKFISHQNTPIEWQEAMSACTQINQWPILMDENDTCMLASPIIFYDHPELSASSPGDLFDSTEIEEALLLHLAPKLFDACAQLAVGGATRFWPRVYYEIHRRQLVLMQTKGFLYDTPNAIAFD